MSIKRRARNEEQKQERRQRILDAARDLFATQRYEAINIIDVAKRVDLAKGTVYLYFKTKEALFLEILQQEFLTWFNEIDAALSAPDAPNTDTAVAALMTDSLVKRPELARLFAIAHVILEHNIDYEAALTYKQMLAERVTKTGALLENCLPGLGLNSGQGIAVLLRAYALVIGIEHVARTAPVVDEVLNDRPELTMFRVDFSTEFYALLLALLRHSLRGGHNE